MCCHSAGGAAVPPFFILQDLKKLPQELNKPHLSGPDEAWYCSTQSGWMTEGAFFSWVMMFIAWTSQYRVRVLPPNLREEQILLILDGHTSRRCPWAIPLLRHHNISVLILPAHTTHLLQAFDVVLASPLKSHFRRFLSAEKDAQRGMRRIMKQAAWSRLVTVSAFIRAWRAVTSGTLCARSFEHVGIFPLNPQRVLDSPFVVDTDLPCIQEKNAISNEMLTTAEMEAFLIAEKERKGQRCDAPLPDFANPGASEWPSHRPLVLWMRAQDVHWGRLLSWPLDIFSFVNGRWSSVESFLPYDNIIQTTQSILNMKQRLATLEGERGNEHLQAVMEKNAENQHVQLQADVIQTSARQIAESIVAEKLKKQVTELGTIMHAEVINVMHQFVDEIKANDEAESETNRVIVEHMDKLTRITTSLITSWISSGTENQISVCEEEDLSDEIFEEEEEGFDAEEEVLEINVEDEGELEEELEGESNEKPFTVSESYFADDDCEEENTDEEYE